jgi:hypothetical protein
MKQQTAVEWLAEQINGKSINYPYTTYADITISIPIELFEQAKQVEKGQMEYMFECGRNFQLTGEGTFTRVYNETHGQ